MNLLTDLQRKSQRACLLSSHSCPQRANSILPKHFDSMHIRSVDNKGLLEVIQSPYILLPTNQEKQEKRNCIKIGKLRKPELMKDQYWSQENESKHCFFQVPN